MFTKLTDDYDCWPASARCDSPGALERTLIERRADIELLGYITDAEADYSYHDFAFIRLDGQWYMLETSGCSCPSPSETWSVKVGPVSASGLRAAVESARDVYGPTASQWDEFVAMCADAEAVS